MLCLDGNNNKRARCIYHWRLQPTTHFTSKLLSDRKLARLPIRVDAISGRRAGDLSASDVEGAARYRFVILMLGIMICQHLETRFTSDVAIKLSLSRKYLKKKVRVKKCCQEPMCSPSL